VTTTVKEERRATTVQQRDIAHDALASCSRRREHGVSVFARWVLTAVLLGGTGATAADAQNSVPATPVESAPLPAGSNDRATQALQALRAAWFAELDDLTGRARALAVADDTYAFVVRPNLPYVSEHYARSRLPGERIDTVLIIDANRKPVFWRRLNDKNNRGFPDAEIFLRELPPLQVPDAPGVPSIAGAARLAAGPALVVAMPIYPASTPGNPRGWLILGRTLDAAQWRRYTEAAHVSADLLAPGAITGPGYDGAALRNPLMPFVRTEATQLRGMLAIPDLDNRPLQVFSVSVERPAAMAPTLTVPPSTRRLPWLIFAALLLTGIGVWGRTRRRSPAFVPAANGPSHPMLRRAREPDEPQVAPPPLPVIAPALAPPSTPQPELEAVFNYEAVSDAAAPPAPVSEPSPPSPAEEQAVAEVMAPMAAGITAIPRSDAASLPTTAPQPQDVAPDLEPLSPIDPVPTRPSVESTAVSGGVALDFSPARARPTLSALHPAFRYQPQFDLQTGRLAGAESMLFFAESGTLLAATLTTIEEFEFAGLGMSLLERWLREACTERRFWLRQTGGEFPVAVPVSATNLVDPGFLPLVRRVLSEYELPPRLLELEVSESTLVGGPHVREVLLNARAAGIAVAVDRFTASSLSLQALALLPVTKLRVEQAVACGVDADGNPAPLFAGIVGAARGLRIVVCATGVDSPEVIEAIERRGCQLAQGAALGAPVDGEGFLGIIRGSGVDTVSLPTLELDDALSETPQLA
jgi:EAL domain-containing protein (putative c-di-GMP-specific phosphodiesterase class I)